MNTFDKVNFWIRNSEASVVNFLSAIAPWAAPLAPAYMTFSHMTGNLNFPSYIAWAVAAVVEVLGLSSISTILAFWAHNRRYKRDDKKAPTGAALFSFISYLAIVLMINVVIDAASISTSGLDQEWVVVGARALLTLLSIPAAIILAVRTQHKELLDTIEEDRQQRRVERLSGARAPRVAAAKQAEASSQKKKKFLLDYRTGKFQGWLAENGLSESAESIARGYEVSERTAFRWLSEIKNGG